MNNNIIKDLINLKIEIIEEISQHLPPATKEKLDRLEYEFMSVMNEMSKEYLEKTKKPEDEKQQKQMKKVPVE